MRQCLVTFAAIALMMFAGNVFAEAAKPEAKPKVNQQGQVQKQGQAQKQDKTQAQPQEGKKKDAASMPRAANVNDSNFKKEVLEAGAPVIALFWSPQCGPCDEVTADLESTLEGKAKVVRINTKMAYRAQAAYKINEVPAFLLFLGGKESARATGIMSKEQLLKKLGFN